MARYAVIENNICINIVEADAGSAESNFILLSESDDVGLESVYDPSTNTWGVKNATAAMGISSDDLIAMAKQELKDTDWTQLPDVGLTSDNVLEWRTYRAGIREIKDGQRTYENWPTQPNKEYV
tara:strand:- start:255 stop:626 length:372 start_codon:yes stop_codon:yes gene_type:complete